MEEKYVKLIESALIVRSKAYIPYSNYSVGAAILTKEGKIYDGCNIECGSFSPTSCAERVAFYDAIKNGERDFEAIAVVAGTNDETNLKYASPCGVCRQVMSEFCDDNFKIILPKVSLEKAKFVEGDKFEIVDTKIFNLNEFLPFRFVLEDFK